MPRPEVLLARQLRRTMSYPEVVLWQRLRGGGTGAKFRKQHPIGPYVVDFCCLQARLVIEVDGTVHDGADRRAHDGVRDRFLKQNGFRVLRLAAVDVLRDLDVVIAALVALIEAPLHRPMDGPPPRAGEES